MNEHYYAVIMAGGGGTRLWPLSRQTRPKQLLKLLNDQSMFQLTVQRIRGLFPPERIFVVTVEEQASALMAQSPEIPPENFLLEPSPKGTASVVGLAAVMLAHRNPDAVMAVLTADHYIEQEERFRAYLVAAMDVAQQDYLVTLGIPPSYPSTGYGYIQLGSTLGGFGGFEVFSAVRFKEKPNRASAEDFIQRGDHAWNSGMFIWRVNNILTEFKAQMPDLYQGLMRITEVIGTNELSHVIDNVWAALKAETIDYGIMEGAGLVAVIPAEGLGWMDIGSWESLFDFLPADEAGNVFVQEGENIVVNTKNSLLLQDPAGKLTVTIGVEDLVIVDTGDVLLVCQKGQSQSVRDVVAQLRQSDLNRYL